MVMQKPSKIQGIEPRVMNFRESIILYYMDWPAENEQNPPSGFRDREPAPQPPPFSPEGPDKFLLVYRYYTPLVVFR